MKLFPDNKSGFKRAGIFALVALFMTLLSFGIVSLEYTVLNFGDSDLPPYRPDTPFERAVDIVWFAVTISAGLLWIFVIIYVIALIFRAFKRRVV
ncbi:MAG TPA: hypothetical protein VN048_11680 [Verrucomicrobiae bacterium]|jgi:hypothetical protein|nr:hypothetical protein [Verrucomicrobiae bacterium]